MDRRTRGIGVAFILTILSAVMAPGRVPGVTAAGDPAVTDVTKAPPEVLARLRAGQPQEVTVLFDDRAIQDESRARRQALDLPFENDEILAFKAHAYAGLKDAVLRGTPGVSVVREYSHLPMSFIRVHDEGALMVLLRNPSVTSVHENGISQLFLAESLPLIHQAQAQAAGKTGAGAAVAVLDTGVNYGLAGFGTCPTAGAPGCRVVYAQDFAYPDNARDNVNHGTRVAGIVLGAAPQSNIIALDVYDEGVNGRFGIYDDTVQNAVNWCIAHKAQYNIVAMNMSFGGFENYATECTGSIYAAMFGNARSAGLLPVVASGNCQRISDLPVPACAPGAVRVGAVFDATVGYTAAGANICRPGCFDEFPYPDLVPCWSNSASMLTLLAPGCEETTPAFASFEGDCGTSFSAPFVAGSAAALRAATGFPSDQLCKTVQRMTYTGAPVTDQRNGLTKPRLDLGAAVGPLPIGFRGFANPVQPLPGSKFKIYPGPEHVVAGDFNGDGRQDVFLHNASTGNTALAQSNGDGTFVTLENPIAPNQISGDQTTLWGNINTPIIVDHNADGRSDIAIFLKSSTSTIFRLFVNNGNGTFTRYTPLGGLSGVNRWVAGDFAGDGRGDLYALWRNSGYNRLFLSNGNGTYRIFDRPMAQGDVDFPTTVLAGRFNAGDQQADLFFHWKFSGENRLFLANWGGTTFTQHVNVLPPASVTGEPDNVIAGDFNGNGWNDLIAHWTSSGQNKFFYNAGDGSWYELSSPRIAPASIAGSPDHFVVGDFNGDFKDDVYFHWKDSGANRIFLGRQTSEFNAYFDPICDTSALVDPNSMVPGDFNGDGRTDVFFMWEVDPLATPPWKNSLNLSSTD